MEPNKAGDNKHIWRRDSKENCKGKQDVYVENEWVVKLKTSKTKAGQTHSKF